MESTVSVKKRMADRSCEKDLYGYLAALPAPGGTKRQSVSARACFDRLYSDARKQVAAILTASDMDHADMNAGRMADMLSRDERLYDYEKVERIREEKKRYSTYTEADVGPADIESVILSAVPRDRNGNLVSLKNSSLENQFLGKRLSRQRLTEIISGNSPITRYDLLTLLFFNVSQTGGNKRKERYLAFVDTANRMLDDCNMGPVYVTNPYECFLLMCLLSEDPLGTYADVWEMSYSGA